MTSKYCSVDGCHTKVASGISFFRCPKDERRCQLWRTALGFIDNHKYANITPEQCNSRIRICGLHFTNNCFTNDMKNHIYSFAIPSLFLSSSNDNSEAGPSKVNYFQSKTDVFVQTDAIGHQILQQTASTQTKATLFYKASKRKCKCLTDNFVLKDSSIQTDRNVQKDVPIQTGLESTQDKCCQTPKKYKLHQEITTSNKDISQYKQLQTGISLEDVIQFFSDNYPAKSAFFLSQLSLLNETSTSSGQLKFKVQGTSPHEDGETISPTLQAVLPSTSEGFSTTQPDSFETDNTLMNADIKIEYNDIVPKSEDPLESKDEVTNILNQLNFSLSNRMDQYREVTNQVTEQTQNIQYGENLDLFFECMLKFAKTLDPVDQISLQKDIANIIFDMKIRQLRVKQGTV